MKCLLVEPGYKAKYPNLGLMKISTKLKQEGHSVIFVKGIKKRTLEEAWNNDRFDEIYITTLFTYEAKITIETINHYKTTYPSAKIHVGGILASLMPDFIEKETGIKPTTGYSKELDLMKPDYDLYYTHTKWDNFSFVFTSRGCVNKCSYCAVPTLEPETWINPNWKKTIDFRRTQIILLDNNLTAWSIEHFADVMHFLRKFNLGTTFDSGLDCRLFNDEHLKHLQGVRINKRGLRFAFDHMGQEGHIQKTIKKCMDGGIAKDNIRVYILFNFNDTPQEAEYRAREVVKLKCDPYPQQYTPLNQLSRRPRFVGKYWTGKLAHEFRAFYHLKGYFMKMSFPEYLELKNREGLIEQYHKYPWNAHGLNLAQEPRGLSSSLQES